jgi:hypothetical protein
MLSSGTVEFEVAAGTGLELDATTLLDDVRLGSLAAN